MHASGSVMPTVAERLFHTLQRRLRELRAGTISVVDAQVESQFDSVGEEHVKIILIVSEPPSGESIWSLDDAFRLRQAARRVAADVGLPASPEITMTMAGDAGTQDDGDDDSGASAGDGE